MEDGVGDRVSLLVLRVWAAGESERERLRIRATTVTDVTVARPEAQTVVMADHEQVCEFVRAWLTACATGNPDDM